MSRKRLNKISKRNVWISEKLYKEIKLSQSNLQENTKRKKDKVTFLETTDKLGEYLNSIRNNKLY